MNAFRAAQLLREARAAMSEWSSQDLTLVQASMPSVVRDNGQGGLDWAMVVQAFRRPGETPVGAAERLALYVTVHAERYDQTPTLATLATSWQEGDR